MGERRQRMRTHEYSTYRRPICGLRMYCRGIVRVPRQQPHPHAPRMSPAHMRPIYPARTSMPLYRPAVTQQEVEALYSRFRALDRGRKGYITADEFLAIPELSINPLAQRLARLFESVNFKEFVRLLAPFSARTTVDMKLAFMFEVCRSPQHGIMSPASDPFLLVAPVCWSAGRPSGSTLVSHAHACALVVTAGV